MKIRHGMIRDRFWWTLVAIGVLTVANGLAQLLVPGYVLSLVATETSFLSKHLIASLGMLVALFGGMFLNALLAEDPQHAAVLWTGFQKFGTAIVIGLGVQHATYIAPVVALAVFDLVCAVMIVGYWFRLKQVANESQRK